MPSPLRILWVKSAPLFPLNTGGRKRTHAMLRELSRHNTVTFLAFESPNEPISAKETDADYAARKRWISLRSPQQGSLGVSLSLLRNLLTSPLPWALEKWVHPSMTRAIEEECHENGYDLVICDFLYPAPNAVQADVAVPMVLFQHNMESQIWERMAANKRNLVARAYFRSQFRRMFLAESQLSQAFAGVITVSPDDATYARERYELENVIGSVPTGVDTDFFSPSSAAPSPRRIGFLGSMDWMPNIEAVLWFTKKILPLIHHEDPAVEFAVIGRNPPPSIRDLATIDDRILVTGTVEDIRPLVSDCRTLVVPLLSGGGTRIKILEAIALGVPVVSTTVGAEGLSLIDGVHLLLAETEEKIANSCLRIIRDDELHDGLSKRGRERVVDEHGWAKATDIFLHHCRQVLSATAKNTVP